MSRPLRLQFAGALYHVTSRGNERKTIYRDKDSYLLELCRYIVLNPVRAKGMIDSPADWPWSSYQDAIGERASPNWLATDALLLQFAKSRKVAIKRYSDFVAQGLGIDVWLNLKNQVFLGSSEFVKQHLKTAEDDADLALSEVPKKQSGHVRYRSATLKPPIKTIQNWGWQKPI